MADIKQKLENIKNALFGRDVRDSIHDGIDAINKEVEGTTTQQNKLQSQFNQLIIDSGNSNAEIVDARVKANGTAYDKLGDRLDEVDSQLAHIATVNILNYSSLCKTTNGVVDWTNAFQQAFNDLSDCGTLIIPSGEYYCDKATLFDKSSIIIQCNGVIKPLPNKNPMFGTFYFKNIKNSLFLNLSFDGNKQNVTHSGEIGVDCMLALENCYGLTFKGFDIKNTIMCGVCSNGNIENITFEDYIAEDIGENLFYLSGENNKNITFKNGVVTNIGTNSINSTIPHSSCIIKNRNSNDLSKLNDNIVIDGLFYTQTISDNYVQGVIWAYDVRNIYAKNIKLVGTSNYFAQLGYGLEKFECVNLDIENRFIYNIHKDLNSNINFTVKDSVLRGDNSCFNVVNIYDNCVFEMVGKPSWFSWDTNIINDRKIEFNKCVFNSQNEKITLRKLDVDLIFNNCVFNKIGSNNPGLFLTVGSSSSNEDKTIFFNNCDASSFDFAGMLGIYSRCNLSIHNTKFKGYIRSYNDIILKKFEIDKFVSPNFKIDTYVKSDKWLIGDIYNSNNFNCSRNIRQYTLNSWNEKVSMDIRTIICKSIDLSKNIMISTCPPIDYTLTMDTNGIIVLNSTSHSSDVIVSMIYNISN